MTESLKKKTVSGLIWNAIDKVGFQIIAFIVGIITARLLSPKDFGLIGALSLFTVFSNILIDSGFSTALIRRKVTTQEEYSSVFYFNLILSISLYLILFASAPLIASFFNMPELTSLSRFIFLAIIINSAGVIQITILTKEFKFKILTLTNIIALIVTSVITIWMALHNFSYWAIAWQQVLMVLIRVSLLWLFSNFKPCLTSNFRIIKELFLFSGNLVITNILNVLGTNLYNVIIGKSYTVKDLGYYTQAQKFQMIPSTMISQTLIGVAYPIFSQLNSEPDKQVIVLRKMMRISAFLIFPIMMTAYAMAEDLFSIVLSDKWLNSVDYFKILVIASLVFPFRVISLNLLIAQGHSKLYFNLELIKNILILVTVIFSFNNINFLLYSYVASNFLSFLINTYWVGKYCPYKFMDFVKDIAPYFTICLGITIFVYLVKQINLSLYTRVSIQLIGAGTIYFCALKILGSKIFEDTLKIFQGKKLSI